MLAKSLRTYNVAWASTLMICSLGGTTAACAQTGRLRNTALTVEQSLERLNVRGNYEVECVAAEPHVVDPIDATVDEQGRIWVVEMRDYPMHRSGQTPSGCIKVLMRNASGNISAAVFADRLEMPTGLALWNEGVVATLAGEVAYFPDEDGDLLADSKQTWITGLSTGNEQLRANHPTLASDGWWYVASGLRGGKIQAGPDFPVQRLVAPIDIGSRDFRFHLRSGKIEAINGPSQFGLSFDSFGDRFLVSNRNPARKVVFEQCDLVGNPLAGLVPPVVDVLPFGAESVVRPTVDAWTTSNLHAGQYTAACGVTVIPDQSPEGEPGEFSESVYVCEPTGSLVTRDRILRTLDKGRFGWQVVSNPREKTQDWLTSTDPWFRPVNLSYDRDGSLLVVDMHRAVIEHPQWVPEELKNRTDEQYGNDCGRLYAIRPIDSEPIPAPDFEALDSISIVRLVASSNIWIRCTATRLILQLDFAGLLPDQAQTELLNVASTSTNAASAVAAIELYLATRDKELLAFERVLKEATNAEQSTAATLALLQYLGAGIEMNEKAAATLSRQTESNIRSVQIEALLAVARSGDDQLVPQPLVRQLFVNKQMVTGALRDPYLLIALAGVLRLEQPALAKAMLSALSEPGRATEDLDPDWVAQAISRLLKPEANVSDKATEEFARQTSKTASILLGAPDTKLQYVGLRTLATLAEWTPAPDLGEQISGRLVKLCTSATAPTSVRVAAIELMANFVNKLGLLRDLSRDLNPKIATAAWNARANLVDPELPQDAANALLGADATVRAVLIQLAVRSSDIQAALLDRFVSGAMSAKDIGADSLRVLSQRSSPQYAAQFKARLEEITNSDRARVVQLYRECLDLPSDPNRGKKLFSKNCASCHKIGNLGQKIGPDISDSRTQKPLALLTSILNPNLAVDNNYFRYQLITADGNVYEGIKIEEDTERIVLLDSQAKRLVIEVSEIEATRHSGLSLMPDGLENQLSLQQMADLISYVKNWRYLDGQVPSQTLNK